MLGIYFRERELVRHVARPKGEMSYIGHIFGMLLRENEMHKATEAISTSNSQSNSLDCLSKCQINVEKLIVSV